jgi:hypothetical protein
LTAFLRSIRNPLRYFACVPERGFSSGSINLSRTIHVRGVKCWDEEVVQAELAALQQEDFDVNLIGFEDEELARLLAAQDVTEGLTDEDAVPPLPQTPTSVAGDLWILGGHKLLVGDATVPADVERLMAGDTADLVFTDPPYNVDYQGYTEERQD